jgi:hypothetical protein
METATNPVEHDKPDQLQKAEGVLLDQEALIGVYDMKGGGTGFVAITDKRVIVYDKAYVSKMKAMVTIPYRNISTIGASDEGRFARGYFGSSKLAVRVTGGHEYEWEFRTADKAHKVYGLIVRHIL